VDGEIRVLTVGDKRIKCYTLFKYIVLLPKKRSRMKNYLFLIIAIIIYAVIIIVLALKAKDIYKNPKKYNEIKGWRRYRYSYWYEPLDEYHRKFFAKNYVAPIIVFVPLMLGLNIAYFVIGYLIQKYIFIPEEVMFLHGEGSWIGGLGAVFYAIELTFWIIYHCCSPITIACTMTAFNSKSRSGDWKKLVCGMLVASVICLPVMFAGINTYAYASDKGLALNDVLQINEKHILYEDIERVETEYRSNKDQTEYYFSYHIMTEDEQKIDVLKYCSYGEMIWIHNQIVEEDVIIQKAIIEKDIYHEMEAVLESSELEMVKELFEVGSDTKV